MKEFPKPPGTHLATIKKIEEPPAHDEIGLKLGSDTLPSKEMTALEATSFILDTTLLPEHRDDPNILRYISSYLNCRDNKQASSDAGIASNSGRALRARPDIHKAIAKLTQQSLNKYGFDAHEVVEKVKEIAFVDIAELENDDGSYKTSLTGISPETRRAIKKFKVKNLFESDANGIKQIVGELIEVEMWDKMKAIDLLGREVDLFKETTRVEHDVSNNMKDMLLQSKERAERAVVEAREAKTIDVTPKDK